MQLSEITENYLTIKPNRTKQYNQSLYVISYHFPVSVIYIQHYSIAFRNKICLTVFFEDDIKRHIFLCREDVKICLRLPNPPWSHFVSFIYKKFFKIIL